MRSPRSFLDGFVLGPVAWSVRDIAIAAAIALAAALYPYVRAFQFPFALDDYTFLMQAAGIDPAPFSLRRWMTVRGYYEVMLALAGPRPGAWHAVAFMLHATLAVGVGAWARCFGASRGVAWTAVGLFAASPLAFTVLYWIACIQELASGVFLLAAAWWMPRPDRTRWVAVALFAAAMLSKESVLAAPLALAFVFGRRTWPVAAAMFVTGVVIFAGSGLHARMFVTDLGLPYAVDYGTTLWVHLATQIVWATAFWRPYPDRVASPDANLVLPALAIAAVVAIAAIVLRGPARRALVAAAIWFVALLLPVLPLAQHAYAYYGYLPQIGFIVLIAWAVERAVIRLRGGPTVFVAAAAAVVVVTALCAARNTRTHETLKLPNSPIPHDSVLRAGATAGALVAAVRDARLPASVQRVVFMSFPEQIATAAPTPGKRDRPGTRRVRRFPLRDALRDGDLVRLHFPGMTAAWAETLATRDEASDTAIFFTIGFDRIQRVPDVLQAYLLQARGRMMIEDRNGARRDLRRILEIDPISAAARTVLAGLEAEGGRLDEARRLVAGIVPADLPAEMRPFLEQVQQVLSAPPAAPGR
jgi:hypothetical protein